MNSNSAMGLVSSCALLIPIAFIVAFRLYNNRSFVALSINCLIVSIQLLMRVKVIYAPLSLYQALEILNNLLDAPLMLMFLVFFSPTVKMKKRITALALIFVAFELVIVSIFGYSALAVKIVLGPDIALITVLSFIFFLRNVRLAVMNSKGLGKAVMISSVLLSYSIFSLVYIFIYLVKNLQYRDDARLIYYLVSTLSALLMALGILIEKKRIKKLDELKHTRKELATIYGHTKVAALNKDSRFLKAGKH